MIWLASILVLSLGLNTWLYLKSKQKVEEQADNTDLKVAVKQMESTGSQLPNLSVNLTELAAINMQSVQTSKASANHLQSLLQTSIDRFLEMNQLGKDNQVKMEESIEEFNGFIHSIDQLIEEQKVIAEAVSVLEEIASDTNMLAINASVEAARVGEKGKGFGVIAKSVSALASKSLKASNKIKKTMSESNEHGRVISNNIQNSTDSLEQVSAMIRQIIDAVDEGKQSFEENSDHVQNLIYTADRLEQSVYQNLGAVQDSSQLAIEMGIQISDLHTVVKEEYLQKTEEVQFIKPAHVFHFNYLNTLPALNRLKGNDTRYRLPDKQDPKISPSDVYQQMTQLIGSVSPTSKRALQREAIDIKPVDVLKASLKFYHLVSKGSRVTADSEFLAEYIEWKKNRSVAPSDVLDLLNHFRMIIS